MDRYIELMDRIHELEAENHLLPKGSISYKKIKDSTYPYLQLREGRHVRSSYISKEDLPELQEKIVRRRQNEEDIRKYKLEVQRIVQMEGLRTIHQKYHMLHNVRGISQGGIHYQWKSDLYGRYHLQFMGNHKRYTIPYTGVNNLLPERKVLYEKMGGMAVDTAMRYLRHYRDETCGIRKEKARTIAANYLTKSEMLMDFQRGISISLYHEKQKEKEVREVSAYKTVDDQLEEINVNK